MICKLQTSQIVFALYILKKRCVSFKLTTQKNFFGLPEPVKFKYLGALSLSEAWPSKITRDF